MKTKVWKAKNFQKDLLFEFTINSTFCESLYINRSLIEMMKIFNIGILWLKCYSRKVLINVCVLYFVNITVVCSCSETVEEKKEMPFKAIQFC